MLRILLYYLDEIMLFLLASVCGWSLHYFVRLRNPVKGISGPAFAHTMGNVNNIMIEQNKEIARLSIALTHAEEKINDLEEGKKRMEEQMRIMTDHNRILEKQVKALTDEVERLITRLAG